MFITNPQKQIQKRIYESNYNYHILIMTFLQIIPIELQHCLFYEWLDVQSRYVLKHVSKQMLQYFIQVNICKHPVYHNSVVAILPTSRTDAFLQWGDTQTPIVNLQPSLHCRFFINQLSNTLTIYYDSKGECVSMACHTNTRKRKKMMSMC